MSGSPKPSQINQEPDMHKEVPHRPFVWRLVSAGTLLTVVALGGLSAARGQDILRVLEEEMTALQV